MYLKDGDRKSYFKDEYVRRSCVTEYVFIRFVGAKESEEFHKCTDN